MSNYSEETIEEVWRKGIEIPGQNRDIFRKDAAGAIIKKSDRRVNSEFGWEIDHVCPKAQLEEYGIPEERWDDIENLRPFQADNNRKKSDDYPRYTREKAMNEDSFRNEIKKTRMVVNFRVQREIKEHYNLNIEIDTNSGKEDDV